MSKEYYTKWREKNREKYNTYHREYNINRRANDLPAYLLRLAKIRADKIGVEFNLRKEDIVVPDVCPVLKTPFEYGTRHGASLDRIDSSGGYTTGNVQVLSKRANGMKTDATQDELVMFAKWILSQ